MNEYEMEDVDLQDIADKSAYQGKNYFLIF